MNDEMQTKGEAQKGQRRKRNIPRVFSGMAALVAVFAAALLAGHWALAQSQPVLAIAPLGSNQFNIVITNAVTTTNYTLFARQFLEDPIYPWEVVAVSDIGQTNFLIDGGSWDNGFFRVLVGTDSDGDGIPDWQDAAPLDPNIGQLQVIIYSPANGSTISN